MFWFVFIIFVGVLIANQIKSILPITWTDIYSNLSLFFSILVIISLIFYAYFLEPFLRFFRDEISFGKYKGTKWNDIPSSYLEWIVDNFNDQNKTKALKILKKRSTLNFVVEEKSHPYTNTVLGIIESKRKCWKCKTFTKVIAIKFYSNIKDEDSYNYYPKVEHYIEYFDKDIIDEIQSKYPFYYYRYSNTAKKKLFCKFLY